ncbi:hypothetical protein BKA63DRAFT_424271 [Paraphoma chrysanthemicola]|nr:hypothetical protein BKA63DRAFT_424271 [Paraphoma chrysanthemicola]
MSIPLVEIPRTSEQPEDLRRTLAHALGFRDYPDDTTAEPYLNYISNRPVGNSGFEAYLRLFIYVTQCVRGSYDFPGNSSGEYPRSIRGLIDRLKEDPAYELFWKSVHEGYTPRSAVEDGVMHILGVRTMMLSSFTRLHNGLRRVCVAFNNYEKRENYSSEPGYSDNVRKLISGTVRLNAWRLDAIAGVEIEWTMNVSRHMLLSQRSGRYLLEDHTRRVLEVFALPCAFKASECHVFGIEYELIREIRNSYAILFNAWPVPWHAKYGRFFGVQRFCWCEACSAQRYKQKVMIAYRGSTGTSARSEFDPMLERLMDDEASDWTIETFPSLWSRITALEKHLQTARPRSIWILLRDRRDTLQYYTFVFATVVVCLTIVQVLLAVAQVVGSFHD